jgi:hypothetical protein
LRFNPQQALSVSEAIGRLIDGAEG